MNRHENLVVCGPSGTGVSWFSLEALGGLVHRHRADDSITRVIKRIMRAEFIVIDDIGLLPSRPKPPKRSTASSTPSSNTVVRSRFDLAAAGARAWR